MLQNSSPALLTLEELYGFIDETLGAADMERVRRDLDRCQHSARQLARIEATYRAAIVDHLQGQDVPLPPPSRFVMQTTALLAARMGLDAPSGASQALPPAIAAILDEKLPEDAVQDAEQDDHEPV